VFGKLRVIFFKLHVIVSWYITTLCCNNVEPSRRQISMSVTGGDAQRLLHLGYATCFTMYTTAVESKSGTTYYGSLPVQLE
jgi:hypothetical protein